MCDSFWMTQWDVAEFLRRGSKFIYWLLLLAAVLAVILIFVVVYRSSQWWRSHLSEAPRTGCLCKGSLPSLPKRCNDRFDVKIRKVHLTCACSGTVRCNESAGCYYNVILYDFLFLFSEGKNSKDWLRTRRKWPGFCRSKLEPSRIKLRTAYPSYFLSRSPFCHPQPPPSAHGRKMEQSASRQRCFKLQTIPFSLSLPRCQNLAM